MKCKACHHLNNPSDAECLMCGTLLYRGTPPVPAILYVFIAMCIFLPVFSATGGILKVLPQFGVNVSHLRAGGAPGFIPWLLGTFGVSACLYLTRTPFTTATKVTLSIATVALIWTVYIAFSVGLAKEILGSSPGGRRAEAPAGVKVRA